MIYPISRSGLITRFLAQHRYRNPKKADHQMVISWQFITSFQSKVQHIKKQVCSQRKNLSSIFAYTKYTC